ncbi:hypothetical protein DPMN_023780 [Dreissena polymorpha]|uniref:Uncharacterized protein n=1 Tax=Dreissena polymorpha TaxID=45954 RepID=A0A9D4LLC0_DREPO|nr:hypothetical protein DPMN_023780 [Dreissena polymorpha]
MCTLSEKDDGQPSPYSMAICFAEIVRTFFIASRIRVNNLLNLMPIINRSVLLHSDPPSHLHNMEAVITPHTFYYPSERVASSNKRSVSA